MHRSFCKHFNPSTHVKPLLTLASLGIGFALGSIPFGYLVGRIRGLDVRQHGSGNIGFTNVYRVVGPAWAIPVLALDVAKGMIPVVLAGRFDMNPALAGAGAVLGHVFTPWLGFKGGKGVATVVGVSAFLCSRSLAVGLGLYFAVLLATGFVSASSLAFAVALPPLTAAFYRGDLALLVFSIAVGTVVVIRHVANIKRLANGTEPRFGLWLRLFRKQQ